MDGSTDQAGVGAPGSIGLRDIIIKKNDRQQTAASK
jgi:hypothetical protein